MLNLKPGGGEEIIHFDLETYSLDNCPTYIALSYTWGDPKDTVQVLAGGKVVEVTRNLKDALWQLRKNRKRLLRRKDLGLYPGQSLRLWIDAVCINQIDLEEKGQQVRLMAEIYKCACHVLAWLGPANKNTETVIDYLNKLGEKAEACSMVEGGEAHVALWREMLFGLAGNRAVTSPYITFQRLDRTKFSVPSVKLKGLLDSISGWASQDNLLPIADIKEFFTRPWWSRIWVLQEATLAKDVDFICGSKKINRTRCSAAINAYSALWELLYMAFSRNHLSLTRYQLDIMQSLFHVRPRIMLSMWKVSEQGGFSLAALLRATCVGTINSDRHGPHHLESTKPEDKIFALLGLAIDHEELIHLGVSPRYNIPYEHIYTTTMLALLKQGHMFLLSMCQASRSPRLPSWVPDWSRSVTDMLQDVKPDHTTPHPAFNASGDQSRTSKVEELRRQGAVVGISVMGYIHDEIYQVGRFNDRADAKVVPLEKTSSWPGDWLLEIIRLSRCTESKDWRFVNSLKAAVRTSIGDVGYDENRKLARVGNLRFKDAAILLQRRSKNLKGRISIEIERFLGSKAVKDSLNVPRNVLPMTTTNFGLEIIGKSLGRLPFVTKKGSLGLSSDQIASGDVIAIIQGSQVPFVLRPHGEGRYQVISEAYVDGIMDGEATSLSECRSIVLV